MARGRTLSSQVLQQLSVNQLPISGTLLVAVSGGADSVFLVTVLSEFWQRVAPHRRQLVVAHVNHGLRGRESDADQQFVREYSRSLGLKFVSRRLKLAKGGNLEMRARERRYRALEQIRRRVNARWIVTAHTANDVAETFLLALLHNRDSSLIKARDDSRKVLRPMLSVSREQVEHFLAERKLTWRNDSSNQDLSLERNWVRRELLTLLRARLGIGIVRTLAERAAVAQDERLFVESYLKRTLLGLSRAARRDVTALNTVLSALPFASLQEEFCVHLLRMVFGLNLGRKVGAGVRQLLLSSAPSEQSVSTRKSCKLRQAAQNLPGGRVLRVVRGRLTLGR